MAKYVDGFVLMVPKKNLAAYKKMAKEGGKLWKEYGALDYKECVIDDEKPAGVELTFRKLTQAKPSEVIIFSFITYRSKKQRDEINKKVWAYYGKKYEGKEQPPMPFDMSRMSVAGFEAFVDMAV